jgi:uncharacterized protein YcbK (DUF882 family)
MSTTPGDLTEHFHWWEFDCRDGTPVPENLRDNVRALARALEVIRHAAGDRAVTVMSGYRTPAYNKVCNAAGHSQHMEGRAADIRIAGLTPRQVRAIVLACIARREIPQGGVGIYLPPKHDPGWVHYDIRGTAARWTDPLPGPVAAAEGA